MRLQFLCPEHRRALMKHPVEAADYWHETLERLRRTEPRAATPCRVNLAGCALEAAGIYLHARTECPAEDIQCYTDTALSLIDLLAELHQSRLALIVVAGANAMVEQLALGGGDQRVALEASRRLTLEGTFWYTSSANHLHSGTVH